MAVAVDLPVDGVPQVQPELLTLAALVLEPEVVGLVRDAQVFADLKQREELIRVQFNESDSSVRVGSLLSKNNGSVLVFYVKIRD